MVKVEEEEKDKALEVKEEEEEGGFTVKKEEEAIEVFIFSDGKCNQWPVSGKSPSVSEEEEQQMRPKKQPQEPHHSPLYCPDCGRSFVSPGILNAHRRIHQSRIIHTTTGEPSHYCHDCGKTFDTARYLKKAPLGSHSREDPPLFSVRPELPETPAPQRAPENPQRREASLLPACGKGFTKVRLLRTHQRLHAVEGPTSSGMGRRRGGRKVVGW
ncbi:zinc finger protein 135-like [Oncorhynchus keta]|uniref:zinc finger protein 135-like n=1 Tax=Oncorhynchus keta TaxID=8018 RepID=UPI00227D2321|nr:zinc finger protein 135-like [Oncorhynchus keta]